MEIGEAGGLNYRLNFPQYQQPQEQSQGQPPVGNYEELAMSKDPLANREKLTADYYDNYAALQEFMKDAFRNGIDPLAPDFSQPGGGLAHQTFLKAKANLMYAANALRGEYEAEDQLRPYIAQGKVRMNQGVDPQQDMWASQNQFYSTEPLPFVQNANAFSKENTYTQRDENRFNQSYYDPASQQIDQMVAAGQLSPEEGALQKASLQHNVHTTYPGLLQPKEAKETKSLLPFYQNVTNITRGLFEPNAKDTIYRGKNWVVSNALSGDIFGEENLEKYDKLGNKTISKAPKVIKDVIKDKSGDVYLRFKDDQFDPIKVSDMPPDQVFRILVESNGGKYGGAGSIPQFYQELQKSGLMNQNFSTEPNTVFGQQTPNAIQQTTPVERFKRLEQDFKTKYDKVVKGDLSRFNIKVPNGPTYSFTYDDDKGYYLENWKEFGLDKETIPKNLSYEDFIKFLDDNDILNKIYNKDTVKKVTDGQSNTIEKLPNETQAEYDLRVIRARRNSKPDSNTTINPRKLKGALGDFSQTYGMGNVINPKK